MIRRPLTATILGAAAALALVVSALLAPVAESRPAAGRLQQDTAVPTKTPAPTSVPVNGKIAAENACYVRFPDMPPSPYSGPGRYGVFGGFNPDTGVLVTAGGAAKTSDENTIAYYRMYGIKLDSPYALWNNIPYNGSDGYTRENDKGCREMTSVNVSGAEWWSVLGKDGCDNGRIDRNGRKGGDIRGIRIGNTADANTVEFVPGMGIDSAPPRLTARFATLVRLFATFDSVRNRVVLGQGTFNDKRETETQDEIYEAHAYGSSVRVNQLYPSGPIPERRYGSCAAFVSDKDSGVDGVLVMGGAEGGPPGTTRTFSEVWWLDFTKSASGEWKNITTRFANQKDFGGRSQGACAYDAETKYYYSWMGRASASIPQGASSSSGAWRVNLAQLGDPAAPLNWERLAPDNQTGLRGRSLIPNVWDAKNKRMFVLAGRLGLDEMKDVWAIYPGVTGDACATLDPYAPYAPINPTATPAKPVVPTPEPPPVTPSACPQLTSVVPAAVVAAALADPSKVLGWGDVLNPALAPGPNNPYLSRLGLQNPSAPYNPTFNSVIFKAGCP
jgi:hypothetical protein